MTRHANIDWEWLFAMRSLQDPDEDDLVADVGRLFVATSDERIARARAALARGDVRAVRFEAHALRGSAAVIGAHWLRTTASEVEAAAEANDIARLERCVEAMARATWDVQQALAAVLDPSPALQSDTGRRE